MAASLFRNRLKFLSPHLGGSLHPAASFLSTQHISPTVQLPPLTATRPAAYRRYFSPGAAPDTNSDDEDGEDFPTIAPIPGYVCSGRFRADSLKLIGYGAKFKLDHDGMYMNAFLPGMKRENVKVSVNRGKLRIEGTRKDFEEEEEETKMTYDSPDGWLLEGLYDTDHMTANLKDGVLKVFIPKIRRAIKVE
ncbi:23.5 kDa heat shock protein- mitochondrial [Striga hermonthica]|uniref:23.5 kDa heat shock protein- mitochondrial n=1 Tax=Striga hermonthica TaxID=68872 RepID=A0A9N7MLC1_STRHE|nr:23.5 kDa heat shock protein- mitochondrial [Striga hermonthica]